MASLRYFAHTCVIDTELRGDPLRYLRAVYDREQNTRSHAHPFTQIRREAASCRLFVLVRSIVIKFRDGVCVVSLRQRINRSTVGVTNECAIIHRSYQIETAMPGLCEHVVFFFSAAVPFLIKALNLFLVFLSVQRCETRDVQDSIEFSEESLSTVRLRVFFSLDVTPEDH